MNNIFMILARLHCFLFLSLFALTTNAVAQDANAIIAGFESHRQAYLQEKIFVHTDKETYITGEICWFKIYNVEAYLHTLSALSKVGYIEVLDTANRSVLQAKIELKDGVGSGSFLIPSNIGTGNYILRGYTNLMKNTGADYFFEKQVTIINPGKNDWQNTSSKKLSYELALFPEGGNLLAGVENRVGFKVSDLYGRGVDCRGVLLNDKGDTILTFQPFKFGIGNFSFIPQANTTYTAFVLIPGAPQQQKELPKMLTLGYTMKVIDKDSEHVNIIVSAAGIQDGAPALLFVHTRNVIHAAETGILENGQHIFTVDKNKLGDGISHFTVFNQQNQPVCERLYFKKPSHILSIDPVTDRDYYQQRKKITVDISSSINNDKASSSNLSVAVYRVDSLNILDDQSITSYLLLNADLKGYIESPGWYFNNNTDTSKLAMDNLMLTHGWRRFKWQDVLTSKTSVLKFLPEINGRIISGRLTSLRGNAIEGKKIGYFAAPGTLTQFKSTETNENGIANFEMKNFYTNGSVVAQPNYLLDTSSQLNIESPFSQSYSGRSAIPFQLSNKQASLLHMYVSSQVQNSYVPNMLNRFSDISIDTTPFYSNADYTYLLDNYVRFTTIEEVLKEYVPAVLVRRTGTKFTLPVIDHGTKFILPGSPLLLVDGVPIFDFDKFMLYDAQKYRKLEIVDRRYISGATIYNGILNFTSYKGDVGNFELNPHAVMIDYEGLQLQREFYSPSYETPEKAASHLPDFRTTLFWSPDIRTDTNGKAQLVFYSSDLPGKYALVIQGIAAEGTTGKSVVFFRVN